MSFEQSLLRRFSVLIILCGLALSYIGQLFFDSIKRFNPPKIQLSYNIYIEPQPLSPGFAKAVSFGANEFLADIYWLTLIQYYGGGDPYGKYRKLAELFNLVTELSPKFLAAYQMGLLILPGEGFVDEAIELGKKGQENMPESWEIPYYTGLVYHINKKQPLLAAKEFEKAAAKPNAPANTRYFAAIYYYEGNERALAYQIFKTVYETTDNDFFRERAEKQIKHLEIVFYLEEAVKKFKERYGLFPSELNELVKNKIITEIPVSPLERTLKIDPENGRVYEEYKD